MATMPKPDKHAIRAWLRRRCGSTAPPPSIEQIKADVFTGERVPASQQANSGTEQQVAASTAAIA